MNEKIDRDKEPYTRIPNRLIRSKLLDPIEFRILCAVMTCNPSFPSYEKLAEWCGCSRTKVYHSLKKLTEMRLLFRSKDG